MQTFGICMRAAVRFLCPAKKTSASPWRKPVIALARGGALEIVPEFGGLLYHRPESLIQAIEQWDELEADVDPCAVQAYAAQFSEAEFAKQMKPVLFETTSYARALRSANHSMTAPNSSTDVL